jgi:hypothetical protein
LPALATAPAAAAPAAAAAALGAADVACRGNPREPARQPGSRGEGPLMGLPRAQRLPPLLLAALLPLPSCQPQLSAPVVSDSDFLAARSSSGTNLRERTAKEVEEFVFAKDHSGWKEKSECEVDVDLLWTKEMGASVYSSPVISDLFSDGQKDIVTATFVRYLDVLEGAHGDHLPGWPFPLDYSHFHASPLLWDADSDGVSDLLFVSFNGEVIVLQEDGTPMHGHTHRLPELRVRRDWYEGLEEATLQPEGQGTGGGAVPGGGILRRRRAQELGDLLGDFSPPSPADDWGIPNYGDDGDSELGTTNMWGSDALTGTDEYYASWDVFGLPSADHDEFDKPHADPIAQHAEGIVGQMSFLDGEEHVMVDAHVLSTPVLADVDGDGGAELVCAVSYYYDKQYYADNDVESPEDEDIDMSKYVGGGVVAISLEDGPRKTTLWQVHLDLTTEQTINQATIYAPPVVVDIDQDGVVDVVVGTGLGYVYALRGTDGKLLRGFPVEMGPIQAGVATGDLTGTGSIDIVAVDTLGNMAAFNSKGETLWDRVLSGSVSQAPTLADLDEDGVLEVICATATGDVIVVNGKTGENFANFPVRTGDRVISPVAILPFPEDWESGEGGESGMPRLIVPSFDGLVYIVSSGTGCTDWVDIGEQAYSMPLIDDLDNNVRSRHRHPATPLSADQPNSIRSSHVAHSMRVQHSRVHTGLAAHCCLSSLLSACLYHRATWTSLSPR